jgi:hypothetical protein
VRGVDPRAMVSHIAQALAMVGAGLRAAPPRRRPLSGAGLVDSTRSVYSTWTGAAGRSLHIWLARRPQATRRGSLGVASLVANAPRSTPTTQTEGSEARDCSSCSPASCRRCGAETGPTQGCLQCRLFAEVPELARQVPVSAERPGLDRANGYP